MRTKSFVSITFLIFTFLASGSNALADGAFSSVNLGIDYHSSTTPTPPLGTLGYSIGFETSGKDTWIRPNYGATLGYASGTDSLITGIVDGGVDVVAVGARHLRPLVGAKLAFGWAHLTEPTQSSIGFIYGGILQGGAEVKFSDDQKGKIYRLITSLHYMLGSVGSLKGKDFNSLTIAIGLIF